jgi:sigma-B regulation protein RsbU (phosphoserine phosphatase)
MLAWIEDLAARLDLTADTTYALQLCLEEAVTNIVTHAFDAGSAHDLDLAVWRDAVALHAELSDDGRPFDPVAHELAATAKDLASAQIGGLGIRLMRSFAQQIVYSRTGGRNRLTLSFARR